MRFWCIVLTLWIIGSFPSLAEARHKTHSHTTKPSPTYGTQSLRDELSRIVADTEGSAAVGVEVKSMRYGDTLYSHNADRSYVPASILKVMTAEAALLYLTPNYQFPTTLLTDARQTHGTINGNIYLVHSGDPTLNYQDFIDLMETLKSQQIHSINGNVYIDNTAYDQANYGPGWIWDDKKKCYAAPINASIINHNCLALTITPAKKSGYRANILPSAKFYYEAIENNVVTKSRGARSCYVYMRNSNTNTISLNGCMPVGHYAWGVNAVIYNVMDYNRSLINNLLKRYGIQVTGSIRAGSAPAHLTTIAVHRSEPLNVLITEMLKMSDNVIAGSLFKKMGEFYSKQPGSWNNGGEAVKQILAQRASVDPAQSDLIDGSGLSRFNQVSPAQIMQVLDFAYHNNATNSAFYAALPIAGIDGTLKHRLYNVRGRVHAKTGSMKGEGVSALAGYALSKNNEPIAFVIIVNGHHGTIWEYREMEDKIATALANYSRG